MDISLLSGPEETQSALEALKERLSDPISPIERQKVTAAIAYYEKEAARQKLGSPTKTPTLVFLVVLVVGYFLLRRR